MVHTSSTVLQGPGLRPGAAMARGLGVSLILHLLLLWPSPTRTLQHARVASTIKAELRLPAQGAVPPPTAPATASVAGAAASPKPLLDSPAPAAVPRAVRGKPRAAPNAAAESRQNEEGRARPILVHGDALTRYRLGLAWQLGRTDGAPRSGVAGQAVTVELAVVLGAGRALAVEVVDDGGDAALAAQAVERVRRASLAVAVPVELGDGLLRVSLALRFEP